jgi:hypothetical protein
MEEAIKTGNVDRLVHLVSIGETHPFKVDKLIKLPDANFGLYAKAVMDAGCLDRNGEPFTWYFTPECIFPSSCEKIDALSNLFFDEYEASSAQIIVCKQGNSYSVRGESYPKSRVYEFYEELYTGQEFVELAEELFDYSSVSSCYKRYR